MNIEILSPVGNFEMLFAAVNNGCDAVYLGGKQFGARAFANNFTDEELWEVIKYAHLRGVKVYVTVNTLIFNDEVEDFINYIKYLVEINVDALIMQDLGMISLVHELFPEMEIHASTQAHTYDKAGVAYLKELGVKRVVAARECDLATIKEMAQDVDVEVFVYGALCVSYSGCCLFSSLNGGRSGNRGECVGNCRMLYYKDNDAKAAYHLSMQDLNVADKLDDVLETGAISLKIEGRMKSPAYVGYVTRLFRKIVDSYKNGKKYNISEDEKEKLMTLFYRGFTYGYLFQDHDLINKKGPNHQGLVIGQVLEVNKKYIKIKLNKVLKQGAGIRFTQANKGMIVNFLYDKQKKLINKAESGIVYVDNKVELTKSDDFVALTLDNDIEVITEEIKVDIEMKVKAKLGKKLLIEVFDGKNFVSKEGVMVENSIKAPLTKEKIAEQVSKLGQTVYHLKKLTIINDENIFVGIKDLNELRRKVLDNLDELRIGKKKKVGNINLPKIKGEKEFKQELVVSVRTQEQLDLVKNYNVTRIYVKDRELYKKNQKQTNIYFVEPRVGELSNWNKCVVASTSGVHNKEIFDGDYGLNICNDYTGFVLKKQGMDLGCLSVELNTKRLQEIQCKDFAVLIYGRAELMMIKNNILESEKGTLKDIKGNVFPYYYDNYLHILDCKVIDLRDKIEFLRDFRALRIDFNDENILQCKKIIESVVN